MEVTPEGIKRVESTEFGMRFKNIILDFYEHDEDNEHVRPIAVFLIAWTALDPAWMKFENGSRMEMITDGPNKKACWN